MMALNAERRPSFGPVRYFLLRYKLMYAGVLALILITAFLESFSVVAFFPMFSSILATNEENTGGILGFIGAIVDRMPFDEPIVGAAVLLISVFTLKAFLIWCRQLLIAVAGAKVLYDVKKQIIEGYSDAQYQYILDNKQGTLMYNVLGAPGSVSALLLTGCNMTAALFKMLAIMAVLVSVLPLAALALAVLGLVYYFGIHVIARNVSFRIGAQKATADAEITVVINEFFTGFRQIVTLNTAKWWKDRFDRENRILRRLEIKNQAWAAVPRPVMELSAVGLMLGFVLILWASRPGTVVETLPIAGIFAVALLQVLPSLTSMGVMWMGIMRSLPAVDIAYQAITGPIPKRKDGTIVLGTFNKAIVFEDVYFTYKERDALFSGINLNFERGKITAIVGASGAGKTTLINLILGLYTPTSGRITIDGIPLDEITLESWLGKIGFVSQEPFTSHSTVADNILLGRNGHSRELIIKAAQVANAHEFISDLPEKYETIVGERGMKFSGGQQQRLAIARALLDSPDILIFDEATSSLDTISERLVQQAIDDVSSERTVIIIAHRLTTISNADKIIVLDEGRVVEEGNHEELLSNNGHYSRLAMVNR